MIPDRINENTAPRTPIRRRLAAKTIGLVKSRLIPKGTLVE
jgi:hypothetical protein